MVSWSMRALGVAVAACLVQRAASATTAVGGVVTTTAMSSFGNMIAIGDSSIAAVAPAQSTGHVGVTYFDYRTNDWTGREAVLLNPFSFDTVNMKTIYGDKHTNIAANDGFGHAVECANEETIFISACNKDFNSGRVYLYKGRNAHWTSQQILNSYQTGPSESFSSSADTYFGESLSASEGILAVGCRNCNSTVKGYPQSGEIYIFRPDKAKKSVLWTNTQVLTAKDIYFMGGHVAMHENVIVATGDSKEDFTLNTIQTTPILASIFYAEDHRAAEGPKSKFEFMHNIVTRDPTYQRISDVAVYDMTVALGTYDTVRDYNTIYIFYPNTKKYALDLRNPKEKPRPLSWSLVQVMQVATDSNIGGALVMLKPIELILWKDEIFLRTKTSGGDIFVTTNRTRRSAAYKPFYISLTDNVVTARYLNHQMTISDYTWFQDGLTSDRSLYAPLNIAPAGYSCLHIWVEDEFDDGWDVAELIVESPTGVRRSYKTECDSVNPLVHRYCPIFNDEVESKGIHKMYVINAKEAKFNWEILWRVYDEATAKWYVGDIHTEMDFEWQYHDREFLMTRIHKERQNATCTVCPGNADEWETYQKKHSPPKPKAKILQNLRARALHSRSDTSSPTMSPAPTIAVDLNTDWNYIEMINDVGGAVTDSWFDANGRGTSFYISDTEGKKLIYSGSSCEAGNIAVDCYVKLDDGDYTLRVTGANDVHTLERRWKFCQGLNYQASQTELYFTIVDGVCFPVMTRHQTLVCDNILKVTNLYVEVSLTGDFSKFITYNKGPTASQLQPIAEATSSGLQQIFGFELVSSSVVRTLSFSQNAISLIVDVGFKQFDQNMYSILKSLELGGGLSYRSILSNDILSAPASAAFDSSVVEGLTGASVHQIRIADETIDYSIEDESNYHKITDFIPAPSNMQTSANEWIIKSEYAIAIFGYVVAAASLFVTVGFIYSTVKKQIKQPSYEESPIKPSAARVNLHLVGSSSDDDSDDSSVDGEPSTTRAASKKEQIPVLTSFKTTTSTSTKKVKVHSDKKLRKLLEEEDAVYRKGSRHT